MPSPKSQETSGQTRDININIRAQRNQRDLIDQAARILGKTRSDFMLETACREAEDVLLDQRVFVLDAEAFATVSGVAGRTARRQSPTARLVGNQSALGDLTCQRWEPQQSRPLRREGSDRSSGQPSAPRLRGPRRRALPMPPEKALAPLVYFAAARC